MFQKITDQIYLAADVFSCWLRFRWGRSHYEVSAITCLIYGVFHYYQYINGAAQLFGVLFGLVIYVIIFSLCMFWANEHNKPKNVETLSRPLSVFHTWLQIWLLLSGLFGHVLYARYADMMFSTLLSLGLILYGMPGRKVDHQPPAHLALNPTS